MKKSSKKRVKTEPVIQEDENKKYWQKLANKGGGKRK